MKLMKSPRVRSFVICDLSTHSKSIKEIICHDEVNFNGNVANGWLEPYYTLFFTDWLWLLKKKLYQQDDWVKCCRHMATFFPESCMLMWRNKEKDLTRENIGIYPQCRLELYCLIQLITKTHYITNLFVTTLAADMLLHLSNKTPYLTNLFVFCLGFRFLCFGMLSFFVFLGDDFLCRNQRKWILWTCRMDP